MLENYKKQNFLRNHAQQTIFKAKAAQALKTETELVFAETKQQLFLQAGQAGFFISEFFSAGEAPSLIDWLAATDATNFSKRELEVLSSSSYLVAPFYLPALNDWWVIVMPRTVWLRVNRLVEIFFVLAYF